MPGPMALLQGWTQLPFQFRNKIAARDHVSVLLPLAADQDDGGGQSVGALCNGSTRTFCTHRPGTSDGKASLNDS